MIESQLMTGFCQVKPTDQFGSKTRSLGRRLFTDLMELGIARYDIDHLSNAGPVPGGYDTIDMMRKSYRNNSHPGKKKNLMVKQLI